MTSRASCDRHRCDRHTAPVTGRCREARPTGQFTRMDGSSDFDDTGQVFDGCHRPGSDCRTHPETPLSEFGQKYHNRFRDEGSRCTKDRVVVISANASSSSRLIPVRSPVKPPCVRYGTETAYVGSEPKDRSSHRKSRAPERHKGPGPEGKTTLPPLPLFPTAPRPRGRGGGMHRSGADKKPRIGEEAPSKMG